MILPVLSYCCQSPPLQLALQPVALSLCLHPDENEEHDEKEVENDVENAEKGDENIGMKEICDKSNLFTLASVHSRIIL